MDQVAKAQQLLNDGPMAFTAALFATLTFSMLWLYVRAKDAQRVDMAEVERRHAQELAAIRKEDMERVAQLAVAINELLELKSDIAIMAADARRRMQKAALGKEPVSNIGPLPEGLQK